MIPANSETLSRQGRATMILCSGRSRPPPNSNGGGTAQIWDTLKVSHKGNDATMITKMELVEGEMGRFTMIRGEEPTQTYNRLKTLVNKI
jgi:hypothetical protein